MEKKQVTTKTTGACEKIHKAMAENCPLRSLHSLSLRSKIPISENGKLSPNHSGGKTTDSPSKTRFVLKKLVTPYKTHPGHVNIPIEPGASLMVNEKDKTANPSVPDQHKHSRVIMISAPTTEAGDLCTTKGDKTRIPAQTQATKPATAAVITVAQGKAELPKVKLNKEAKPPGVSVEEKPRKKPESNIHPSNMIVIESPGQGINAIGTPRAESATKPPVPVQGSQPKPKNQPAPVPVPSAAKVMAKRDEPITDKNPGNVGGHDHNRRYSDYIEHVITHMRTDSNVGVETATEKPPTRPPAKRDSFNDRVSNFITRGWNNIKTTHSGD